MQNECHNDKNQGSCWELHRDANIHDPANILSEDSSENRGLEGPPMENLTVEITQDYMEPEVSELAPLGSGLPCATMGKDDPPLHPGEKDDYDHPSRTTLKQRSLPSLLLPLVAMDSDVYELRKRKAKIYSKQVLTLINAFSPDNVTNSLDQDQFYVNLQRIKDKFLEATDRIAGTIVDLETNNKEE